MSKDRRYELNESTTHVTINMYDHNGCVSSLWSVSCSMCQTNTRVIDTKWAIANAVNDFVSQCVVTCRACRARVVLGIGGSNLLHHETTCVDIHEPCVNNCSEWIQRRHMGYHSIICKLALEPCGNCSEWVQRRHRDYHRAICKSIFPPTSTYRSNEPKRRQFAVVI